MTVLVSIETVHRHHCIYNSSTDGKTKLVESTPTRVYCFCYKIRVYQIFIIRSKTVQDTKYKTVFWFSG